MKLYALYDGPNGPTPESKYYSMPSKTLYHVAAVNVKQAILLAARRIWSTGKAGLVEWSDGSQKWFHADGTTSWNARVQVSAARAVSQAELTEAVAPRDVDKGQ